MNSQKLEIIEQLFQPDAPLLEQNLKDYKQKYPYDADMFLLEAYWQLTNGNLAQAKHLLSLSQKYNYYDVDTYFLLGEWHLLAKEYYDAIEYYTIAYSFNCYFQQNYLFYSEAVYENKIQQTQQLLKEVISKGDARDEALYQEKLQTYSARLEYGFDLFSNLIQCNKKQIGESILLTGDAKRFCGYGNPLNSYSFECFETKSLFRFKGELLKIQQEGNSFHTEKNGSFLVPIASRKPENLLTFCQGDHSLNSIQVEENHFNYYRVEGETQISSQYPMIIGEPVLIGHQPSRKKLVISFFVDGLSQKVLAEEGLQHLMPNTFRFFSRGLICENYFTASDWTYPSLASFVSGIPLSDHMMFHPAVNKPLPSDQKILFEYIKEAGYYTAMINGDYRSSSTLGYTRGIDRYVAHNYHHLREGYVISDAIEHIEAFKETDQYLWLTYADLHDIADEYDLALSIQTKLSLKEREKAEKSSTSVKQKYSPEKRTSYIHALQIADIRFQALYDYLEQNYTEEEYIITLFGDHGQTYLLPPGEHHLARYHSNVGFMVRGGGLHGNSKEYMAAVDYPHILCKLAGCSTLPGTSEHTGAGILPKVFGGTKERAFTITETIHPGDPYEAAIHTKDHVFYLTSENTVTEYGRLDPGAFKTKLLDLKGNNLNQPEQEDYYIQQIKERLKYIFAY